MVDLIKTFFNLCKGHGCGVMSKYLVKRMLYSIQKGVMKQRHVVRNVHNYEMILDLYDLGLSRVLIFFGTRELDHKLILERELKHGMTMLDLGANIGYYAIMESKLIGDSGYIYALEPHPANVELLKNNIQLNKISDRIEVHQMGGSNKNSVEKLCVSAESNLHSFVKDKNSSNETVDVPTTTIPEFCKGRKKIDFIRMDIEGYEIEVLEGLLPALEDDSFRPSILFETHRPKYSVDHTIKGSLKAMFEKGYRAKIIVSNEGPTAKFSEHGYTADIIFPTDGMVRGLYYGISNEDAIKFICDIGGVRAVFLAFKGQDL
jgi:FkbM family methyltransferase